MLVENGVQYIHGTQDGHIWVGGLQRFFCMRKSYTAEWFLF